MNKNITVLASGCLTSGISATFFLVLPLAIGAISNGTDYGEQFLGLIATTYLIAFTIAGIVSAAIPASTNQRRLSPLARWICGCWAWCRYLIFCKL